MAYTIGYGPPGYQRRCVCAAHPGQDRHLLNLREKSVECAMAAAPVRGRRRDEGGMRSRDTEAHSLRRTIPLVLSAKALRPTTLSFWFSTSSTPCASRVFWSSERLMSVPPINVIFYNYIIDAHTLPCGQCSGEVRLSSHDSSSAWNR